MKEMPLWLHKKMTFVRPQVGVQGNGDALEVFFDQDPTFIIRDSVIVKDRDPTSMTGYSCSEVLQYRMGSHPNIAVQNENYLKDLESPQGDNLIQEIFYHKESKLHE